MRTVEVICYILIVAVFTAGIVAFVLLKDAVAFARPLVLVALVVPILLAIFEASRPGHKLNLPFDHGRQRSGDGLHVLAFCANALPALLLTIAILVLAGPQKFEQPRNKRLLTNIEFCLDVSGSMTAGFGEGSQYDAAMEAINNFTTDREGDAFGLTIFGNEVLRWVPLTTDLSAIRNAPPFLRPENLPHHFGGTEIGKGLQYCQQTLNKQETGDKMIILLSDGFSADLGGTAAPDLGRSLADDGIVLYCIHIGGGEAPAPLYELSRPNGGEVFAVEDPRALEAVFDHIDEMQPAKTEQSAKRKIDNFHWFAIVGLGALGFYQLTLFGLRYTPW